MNYPRELKLDPDIEEALKRYLDAELDNHYAERSNWVDSLKSWQTDYWAEPTEKVKTVPFRNACNIVIPLTAIAVEAVHAREMTTLFALDEFVNVKLAPQFADATSGIEKAIDRILLKDVDIYKFADSTLLENKKLGSCVGKAGYVKIQRKAIRESGGEEVSFFVTTKQGPTADPVPLAQFLMPFTATDPQLAPWCGEEKRATEYQIRQHCNSGLFRSNVIENINAYLTTSSQHSSQEYVDNVRELQDQNPIQWPNELTWVEIWLGYDVDNDGEDEELVVHYHRPSRTFFSIRYNWHDDLRRPYRTGIYFPMEHRWAGIGIGKQNEMFQREVTVQHRQRIDNATLANMRMYKMKRGIGYGANEPIFPGKIWLLDEMDDIDSFQMGEIYPSSYNNEQQAIIFSQQRTSVNELTLGMPQAGTPGTATGDLARVQEGNRKFDYTYKNSRRFLQQISLDVLCNVAQFGVRDSRLFQFMPNGDRVLQFLTLPVELLRDQLVFELSLAGQNANKLLDRNSNMQLGQIIQQYYGGMFQLAQMTGDQMLMQSIARKGMQAATEAMKQVLESFDFRAPEKIIIEELLNGMLNGSPNSAQPNGGAPQISGPAGMGAAPQMAGRPV